MSNWLQVLQMAKSRCENKPLIYVNLIDVTDAYKHHHTLYTRFDPWVKIDKIVVGCSEVDYRLLFSDNYPLCSGYVVKLRQDIADVIDYTLFIV